ncbi:MAG TPA: hypothetical protein VHF51_08270 [Solirubrobacteraceae bacterium]|nr:hypothetical protein [Solirubrobacteraceae bacterium]
MVPERVRDQAGQGGQSAGVRTPVRRPVAGESQPSHGGHAPEAAAQMRHLVVGLAARFTRVPT